MKQEQKPETFYSTNEVSKMANVSLRQLQWWDEAQILPVKHEGHRRLYTMNDALMVCVVADLKRKGITLRRVRKILRSLAIKLPDAIAEVWPNGSVYLIAYLSGDGRRFKLLDDQADVVEEFRTSYEPQVLVSISAQAWKVA